MTGVQNPVFHVLRPSPGRARPETGPHTTSNVLETDQKKNGFKTSAPVESAGKFYLLALKSHSEPDWATFEKDLAGLRSAMDEETGRASVASWVENLHSKAKIQTYVRKAAAQQDEESLPDF